MRRGWKILIGVLVALAVLVAVNYAVVGSETKSATVNEPGGRILKLPGGEMLVVDRGPRAAPPIVLVHCFTCAIDWWDGMMPLLARSHRVVAVDLLGHGGSEKPASGYSIPDQADLVAQALGRLDVTDAEVVGHSLGGAVVTALAERSPQLVERVVIVDTPPNHEKSDLGLLAKLVFVPVVGEALWRIKPDFATRKGLEVAFAPGFDVPDAFVENVNEMTYDAYNRSARDSEDYSKEEGLDRRMKESGKPLMVIMGAEEQIIDEPPARLAEYRRVYPGTETHLIQGAGHSPNVEKPAETAALVLAFDRSAEASKASSQAKDEAASRGRVQQAVQKREAVRGHS
ncbi:MAG TPA: alpha/beta hydrolase [Solirubrobacterales bacterium]|jgi:pimeloyl-ACP methyl ester carboxylesterase|nr:alpha/beta hydrolase [Solirubrobacterales bacterium]